MFVNRQLDLRGCSWWRDRGRRCECQRCGTLMCKHTWYGDDVNVFGRTTQPWNLEPCNKVMNCACTETTACRSVNSSVNNWTKTHYEQERQTCPSQVEGQTRNRTKELEKAFRHYVLPHAGNLKFRFQHGPFTSFRPVVKRVPAVVLSICRFSRLALTRAWWFALNKQHQRGWGHTVTLARVLWECPG